MRLTDTHCHLNLDQFDKDREEVILRGFDVGVERFLIPGIDIETSRSASELADKYPQIFVAVGVQPNSGMGWTNRTLKEVEEMASHPKVVAIGEIGLDYYWDKTPKEKQAKIFFQQLELAMEMDLPVVIHNREATEDTLAMLKRWFAKLTESESDLVSRPGVLHSFSGNVEDAKQANEINFFLSISGPVTYKNAKILREVVARCDIEKLLIETDSPYLTPQRFRGQRNEPSYVSFIANKISEIRELSIEEVANKTAENAEKLFNWN
ncbi:MAG: TatD family hydrolase [Chloroflexi bacterium]|nr:TatD family hydrolase [Chloroflexota bacterium]